MAASLAEASVGMLHARRSDKTAAGLILVSMPAVRQFLLTARWLRHQYRSLFRDAAIQLTHDRGEFRDEFGSIDGGVYRRGQASADNTMAGASGGLTPTDHRIANRDGLASRKQRKGGIDKVYVFFTLYCLVRITKSIEET